MSEIFKNTHTDKIEQRGFIKVKDILEYVTEKDIFQLVFGFKPKELVYVTSPFRVDKNPGCWFETDLRTGTLRFVDFGNSQTYRGIRMTSIDCFDAVKIHYNLPNFFSTLEFIKRHLIDGKGITNRIKVYKKTVGIKRTKEKAKIYIKTRQYESRDGVYWSLYGISKQNLIDDKVFPISAFKIYKGDKISTVKCKGIAYAYTDFNGRVKIYQPHNPKYKFITNCLKDDIGGINDLDYTKEHIVITKSYKDYRVLKNQGLEVIWFQNEGMLPERDLLKSILLNYSKGTILFDNDLAGRVASEKVIKYIEGFKMDDFVLENLHIPLGNKSLLDPSDFHQAYTEVGLRRFLINNKLIC